MSFISSSILRILARIDRRAEHITYIYASGTHILHDDYEANLSMDENPWPH